MNDWIEQEREWERQAAAFAAQQNRDNLVKWVWLVMGILCLIMLLLVASTPSQGQEIPNHPQRLIDWSFVTTHAVYGAANAFDGYETARHVGVCAAEGNPDLGPNPTSKSIAIHSAVEFGAVVTGDLLLKWWGRHQGVPRWLNNSFSSVGAGIGTFKHIRGGSQWVSLCN